MLLKYQQEDTIMSGLQWRAKIKVLKDTWGTPDEVDLSPNGTAHLQAMLGRLPPKSQVRVDIGAGLRGASLNA
jgi:hypothetical protein